MSEDLPPVTLGAAGLTGRPRIDRPQDVVQPIGEDPETGEPVFATPPSESITVPAACLSRLSSPLSQERGGGCAPNCVGLQEDGGCLADVVKAAQAAGVEWKFDVSFDAFGNQRWTYAGDPIPE